MARPKSPAHREALERELKLLSMERQLLMAELKIAELKASRDNYRKKWNAEQSLASYHIKKNETFKGIASAMRKYMRMQGVDFPVVLMADYAKVQQSIGRPIRQKKFEPKEAAREPLNDRLRDTR